MSFDGLLADTTGEFTDVFVPLVFDLAAAEDFDLDDLEASGAVTILTAAGVGVVVHCQSPSELTQE